MYDENCPMCRDPIRSMSWVRLILNHQRTPFEAAEDMGMKPEDVNNHIYHHVDHETIPSPDNPDYLRYKMNKFANIIELWFDDMVVQRTLDRATMEMALKLVKEIRENLKVIGEMDGQLNRVDPKVQIINITNDFKKLTNVIMMDACDECRPKMLAAVEGMNISIPQLPGGKE